MTAHKHIPPSPSGKAPLQTPITLTRPPPSRPRKANPAASMIALLPRLILVVLSLLTLKHWELQGSSRVWIVVGGWGGSALLKALGGVKLKNVKMWTAVKLAMVLLSQSFAFLYALEGISILRCITINLSAVLCLEYLDHDQPNIGKLLPAIACLVYCLVDGMLLNDTSLLASLAMIIHLACIPIMHNLTSPSLTSSGQGQRLWDLSLIVTGGLAMVGVAACTYMAPDLLPLPSFTDSLPLSTTILLLTLTLLILFPSSCIFYSYNPFIPSFLTASRAHSKRKDAELDGNTRLYKEGRKWFVYLVGAEVGLRGMLLGEAPNFGDVGVAVGCYWTLNQIATIPPQPKPRSLEKSYSHSHLDHAHTHKPASIPNASNSRLYLLLPTPLRETLNHILRSPESSKIFYFLLMNLGYMVVQVLWGVWTNSLGLISDAIHMAFDCAALGVGLFASVMAGWEANGTFTYGYGRVQTLSGFANGVFLILISIFIIFEAIQRVIDPPEMMNMRQLLIVSSGGLAINLWGMYATGGHHHHGHGHSHGGDDHGHGHAHGGKEDHGHEHKHDHDHSHDEHAHEHNLDSGADCSSDEEHDGGGHAHSHDSHGHSHNMRGVFLHVLADTLGSVGVIISTLLIEYTGWTVFDPIASLFIAGLIVASVVPLVIDSGRILCLELDNWREGQVRHALSELSNIEGLESYGAPRFWPKDESTITGSIHIHLSRALPSAAEPANGNGDAKRFSIYREPAYENADRVVRRVERSLKRNISGLKDLTIQIEGCQSGFCPCKTGGRS